MKIPMEYYEYLWHNPNNADNTPCYIVRPGTSQDIINKLKNFNTIYKKSVGCDIIAFS